MLALGGLWSCVAGAADSPARWTVEILERFPHDENAFTQGLVWDDGTLLESTGLYGSSTIRRVDPRSGRVLDRDDVDAGLFAEGIASLDGRLVQLTWRSGLGLVRDPTSLTILETWFYDGEGWGLATHESQWVSSDGSETLTFRDAESFAPVRTVRVTGPRGPVRGLNELEVVDGKVWANVFGLDEIVAVDPDTGRVTDVVDASGLRADGGAGPGGEVLNGIAWDGESWWMTGKLWPWIYRVRLVATEDSGNSADPRTSTRSRR